MSMLRFDWESVLDEVVAAILARGERPMSDASLRWDALALVIGSGAIVLSVTADTDEIVATHQAAPPGRGWDRVAGLADMLGRPLGWCWVGENYRGYRDSFTLALGDVVPDALQPRLTFVAEGGGLCCFDVTPRGNGTAMAVQH